MKIYHYPIFTFFLLFFSNAQASVSPVVPIDVYEVVEYPQLDRGTLPIGTRTIFDIVTMGYTSEPSKTYRGGFVCTSSSNSENGACPTTLVYNYNTSPLTIKLKLTEKRSHLTRDIELLGTNINIYPQPAISEGCSTYSKPYAMNNAQSPGSCNGYGTSGNALRLWFNQSELNKLPVGGIWTGKLVINYINGLWSSNNGKKLSTITVNFNLNLTDKSNIQVWLPQFKTGQPQLDLNIKPKISSGNVLQSSFSGQNTLDLCLYDGYSTNSSSMEMKITGSGGGQGTTSFYLQGKNGAELPYSVNFLFEGDSIGKLITNGSNWSVNNASSLAIHWNRIAPVTLPDISVPVLCWPAKIILKTHVPSTTASGEYIGNLNMIFTPSSSSM